MTAEPTWPPCCFCGQAAWGGRRWTDPAGVVVLACRPCLAWLGEHDLRLR